MDTQKDSQLRTLMQKAQNGDARAYDELLSAIYLELQSYARAHSEPYSDDLIQEIVISMHMARHTYDPSRPFLPWLYAIARYRALDFKRSLYRKERKSEELTEEFSATLVAPTTNSNLNDAFGQLPAKQQLIITLMKLHGYTAEEISKKLNSTTSAIKVMASRAYGTLRNLLTETADEV